MSWDAKEPRWFTIKYLKSYLFPSNSWLSTLQNKWGFPPHHSLPQESSVGPDCMLSVGPLLSSWWSPWEPMPWQGRWWGQARRCLWPEPTLAIGWGVGPKHNFLLGSSQTFLDTALSEDKGRWPLGVGGATNYLSLTLTLNYPPPPPASQEP